MTKPTKQQADIKTVHVTWGPSKPVYFMSADAVAAYKRRVAEAKARGDSPFVKLRDSE